MAPNFWATFWALLTYELICLQLFTQKTVHTDRELTGQKNQISLSKTEENLVFLLVVKFHLAFDNYLHRLETRFFGTISILNSFSFCSEFISEMILLNGVTGIFDSLF